MKLNNSLGILSIEFGLLIGFAAGIVVLTPAKASEKYLYELLGATMASLITTYGIYKMHDVT